MARSFVFLLLAVAFGVHDAAFAVQRSRHDSDERQADFRDREANPNLIYDREPPHRPNTITTRGTLDRFCFTGATSILVPSLDCKYPHKLRMDSVEPGQLVYCRDPEAAQSKPSVGVVEAVSRREVRTLFVFELEQTYIQTTNEHPFWLSRERKWVPARDLRVGDVLEDLSCKPNKIRSISEIEGLFSVYNIKVSGHSTYYASGVLVHNCDHVRTFAPVLQVAGHGLIAQGMTHMTSAAPLGVIGGPPGAAAALTAGVSGSSEVLLGAGLNALVSTAQSVCRTHELLRSDQPASSGRHESRYYYDSDEDECLGGRNRDRQITSDYRAPRKGRPADPQHNGTPGNNTQQNKQVDDVMTQLKKEFKINDFYKINKIRDLLHEEVTGKNFNFHQILELGRILARRHQ